MDEPLPDPRIDKPIQGAVERLHKSQFAGLELPTLWISRTKFDPDPWTFEDLGFESIRGRDPEVPLPESKVLVADVSSEYQVQLLASQTDREPDVLFKAGCFSEDLRWSREVHAEQRLALVLSDPSPQRFSMKHCALDQYSLIVLCPLALFASEYGVGTRACP